LPLTFAFHNNLQATEKSTSNRREKQQKDFREVLLLILRFIDYEYSDYAVDDMQVVRIPRVVNVYVK